MRHSRFCKINSLLLAVLILATAILTGCREEGDTPADTASPSGVNGVGIVVNKISEYVIVQGTNASKEEATAALKLKMELQKNFGVVLPVKTDAESFEKEILVGVTNREESILYNASLRDGEYGAKVVGDRLLLAANGNASVTSSVTAFVKDAGAGDSLILKNDYEYRYQPTVYDVKSLKINGIDIFRFRIVYASDEDKTVEVVNTLQKLIRSMTGYNLKKGLVSSAAEETYEILVGDTGREIAELKTIPEGDSLMTFTGTKLVLGTNGLPYSPQTVVKEFLTKYLGYSQTDGTSSLKGDVNIQMDEPTVLQTGNSNVSVADEAFWTTLKAKTDGIKSTVLDGANPYLNTGVPTFYVSASGSDSNNGTSQSTPWKTVEKVNQYLLQNRASLEESGSVVLFKRGDIWRGSTLVPISNCTVSSYGEGENPRFYGSLKNYADPSLWQTTETANVYVCTESLFNVGVMAFDHSGVIGDENETMGVSKNSLTGLKKDLDFYSDMNDRIGTLYVYSAKGNPGSRFSSIEIGTNKKLVSISQGDGDYLSHVRIDHLTLMYTGSHGIGSPSVTDLTVSHCVIAYLGGSVHASLTESNGYVVRYGNAIEVFGNCFGGFTVTDNYIYQIFDTGITFQFNNTADVKIVMKDIEISRNLVTYTHWSVEWYNDTAGTQSEVSNVLIKGNILQNSAKGWGSEDRANGSAICSCKLPVNTTNFTVEDNIFDRSGGDLLSLHINGDGNVSYNNNTYIQTYLGRLGIARFYNKNNYNFDSNAYDVLTAFHNQNHKVIYVVE